MIENILSEGYGDVPRYQREGLHGPLMKAGDWIGKQSLEELANHPEINDKKRGASLLVGHIHGSDGHKKHVAILSHHGDSADNVQSGNQWNHKKGRNVKHGWYEDSGMGHKYHNSHLVVTGHVTIHPDGKVEPHGDVDMKKSHNLMVYK